MGNDFTKEYPSTWEQDDVEIWKTKALEILKMYYMGFAGKQFTEYNRTNDLLLLNSHVCYGLFGAPKDEADNIETAYTETQRDEAQKIVDKLVEVYQTFK